MSLSNSDQQWMYQALRLAEQAANQGEIPVGAIIVYNNQCIAEGWNQSRAVPDPTAHAEIIVLRKAAQFLNNYRLLDTTVYVTLEPCIMCSGAIIQARVKRVVFGAYDPKSGAAGSRFDILRDLRHNHQVNCVGGILAAECGAKLTHFLSSRRRQSN